VVLSDPKLSLAFLDDEGTRDVIETLAGVRFVSDGAVVPGQITIPIGGSAQLTLHALDASTLRPRLEAELKSAEQEVKRAEGKLRNEKFTEHAPDDLVEAERAKIAQFTAVAGQLQSVLAQL